MTAQRTRAAVWGAVVGVLTSLPLLAFYYLGAQAAMLTFVPFDLFDWLSRLLPGSLIARSIDVMVAIILALGLGPTDEVAKAVEQALALAMVVGTGAVLGIVVAWAVLSGWQRGWRLGAAAGLVLALALLGVQSARGHVDTTAGWIFWLALPPIIWGAALGHLVELALAPAAEGAPVGASRRDLLLKMAAGTAGVALVFAGLSTLFRLRQEQERPPEDTRPPVPVTTLPTPQTGRLAPAPGTRPEVTPLDTFYRVDINLVPIVVDEASWRLEVAGLFARPGQLTLEELRALPAVTMPYTLSCISNPVAGDLIGNTYWTGVRLRDFLQERGLQPEARELYVESADRFYESITMADMLDQRTLLVYGMGGQLLPTEHGFPLRVLIPDRYGMKQPKWIVRLEAKADELRSGYWPEREWSLEARPQIVSVVDSVVVHPSNSGRALAGGIAWSGAHGISKVEVQVDDGAWAEAQLITPPLGELVWTQWRYEFPLASGQHGYRARATDGRGNLQSETPADSYPNGATGYHRLVVSL
ncbi:MAG: molybdopterin-dependent oxidoreductase [Chloroflexota bacterium]